MESAIQPTKEQLIKFFERSPNIILYGLPGVAVQDRWALLTLVGYCHVGMHPDWTLDELEGPYKLSLREIATITGIGHTALRKRDGKDKREGVLDRLQRLGYVTILDARPIDEITGKATGKPQTYLSIHLRKLWEDNLAFSEAHRMPMGKPVNPRDIEIVVDGCVDVVNTQNTPPTVDQGNTYVDDNNTPVDHVNKNVDRGNNRVDVVRSNSAQDYIRPLRQIKEKEETVSQFSENEFQKKEETQKLPAILRLMVDTATIHKLHEPSRKEENREIVTQIYWRAKEKDPDMDDLTFRMAFESAINDAANAQDKSASLQESLCRRFRLESFLSEANRTAVLVAA